MGRRAVSWSVTGNVHLDDDGGDGIPSRAIIFPILALANPSSDESRGAAPAYLPSSLLPSPSFQFRVAVSSSSLAGLAQKTSFDGYESSWVTLGRIKGPSMMQGGWNMELTNH